MEKYFQGYNNERLSMMSVPEVCQLLSRLNGINKTFLPQYQDCVTINNISGRVLVACDLNELRQVLEMKFGDWQLFKTAVNSLIERENSGSVKKLDIDRQESLNQIDLGNSIVSTSSAGSTTSTNNHKYESPQKYAFPKKENVEEFETISEHEELIMLKKKNKMPRNDSVVAQMSYERELINEVMHGFMEMDEEEEEEEDEGDENITPTESISSVLENDSVNSQRRILPVQFSLSSHYSNEEISDASKLSPKDTEPLLGATASDTEAIIHCQQHHASLDEIRQIISKDLEGQGSPNPQRSSLSEVFDPKMSHDITLSTDSAGFGINSDSIEVINEFDKHGRLEKQSELEGSVLDFTSMSSDERSNFGSPSTGSDHIQMITLDQKKDKGPEAFV